MASNAETVLQCSKCKTTSPNPSRNGMTCNRHQISEPTGYCQGTMRPTAQLSTGSYVAPPGASKEIGVQSR